MKGEYLEKELLGGKETNVEDIKVDTDDVETIDKLRTEWNAGKVFSTKGMSAAVEYAKKYGIPSDDSSLREYKNAFSNPDYRITLDNKKVFGWRDTSKGKYNVQFYSTNDLARYFSNGNQKYYDKLISEASKYHSQFAVFRTAPDYSSLTEKEIEALTNYESEKDPLYDPSFKNSGSELGIVGDIVAPRSAKIRANDEYMNKEGAQRSALGGDLVEYGVGGPVFKAGGRVANTLTSKMPRLGNLVKGASAGASAGGASYLGGQVYDKAFGGGRPYGEDFSLKNFALSTGLGGVIGGGLAALGMMKTPMTKKSKANELLKAEYGKNNKGWDDPANKKQTAKDLARLREYASRHYNNRADDFVYEEFNKKFGDMPVMAEGGEVTTVAPDGQIIPLRRYSNRKEIPSVGSSTFVRNEERVVLPEDGRFEKMAEESLGERPERFETEAEAKARENLESVKSSGSVKYMEKAAKEADRRLKAQLKTSRNYEDFLARVNATTGNLSLDKPSLSVESSNRLKTLYELYASAIAAEKPTGRIELAIATELDKLNNSAKKALTSSMKDFGNQAVLENRASEVVPEGEAEKLYRELSAKPDESKLKSAQSTYDKSVKSADAEYKKSINDYEKRKSAFVDEEKAKYKRENAPYEYVSPDEARGSEFLEERGLDGTPNAAVDLLHEYQYKSPSARETTIGDVVDGTYRGTVRDTNRLLHDYSNSRVDVNPDTKQKSIRLAQQLLRDKVVPRDVKTDKPIEALRIPYRKGRAETSRLRNMIGSDDQSHIIGNPPKGESFNGYVNKKRLAGTHGVIHPAGYGSLLIPLATRASRRTIGDED